MAEGGGGAGMEEEKVEMDLKIKRQIRRTRRENGGVKIQLFR